MKQVTDEDEYLYWKYVAEIFLWRLFVAILLFPFRWIKSKLKR
jgi:hypothetical protein